MNNLTLMYILLNCTLLYAEPLVLADSPKRVVMVNNIMYLTKNFPIKDTAGKSFKLSCQVSIKRYGHYAEVGLGLTHSKFKRRTYVKWGKGDSGIRGASVGVNLLPRLKIGHKGFRIGKTVNKFYYSIEYRSEDRSVRWTLSSFEKHTLQQSPWVSIKEELSFNQFSIWAKTKDDHVKFTKIRLKGKMLDITSQVGIHYTQKCTISDINLIINHKDIDK